MPFDRIVERVYSQTDDGEHFYDCIKNVLAANEEVTDQIELTKQQLRESMQTKKQNLHQKAMLQRDLHQHRRTAIQNAYKYHSSQEISLYDRNAWGTTVDSYDTNDLTRFREARKEFEEEFDKPLSMDVQDRVDSLLKPQDIVPIDFVIDDSHHRLIHDIHVNHRITDSQGFSKAVYMLSTEMFLFYQIYNLKSVNEKFTMLENLLRVIREHLHAMHWGMAQRPNNPFKCKMLMDFLDDINEKNVVKAPALKGVFAEYKIKEKYSMHVHMNFEAPPVLVGRSIPNSHFLSVFLTHYMRNSELLNRMTLKITIFEKEKTTLKTIETHEFDLYQAFQHENAMFSTRLSLLPSFNDIAINEAEGAIQNISIHAPRVNGKKRPYNEAEMTAIMANMMLSAERALHDEIPLQIALDTDLDQYTHCVFKSMKLYTYYLVVSDLQKDPHLAERRESVYTYFPYQIFFIITPNYCTFANAQQNTKMWIYQTKQAREALPIINDSHFYGYEYINPANFGIGLKQFLRRKNEIYEPGRPYTFHLNSLSLTNKHEVHKKQLDEHTWGTLDEIRVRCQVITSVYGNIYYRIQPFYEYRKLQLSTKLGGKRNLFRNYIETNYMILQPLWRDLIINSLDALGHPIETWESYQEHRN